MGEKGIIFTLLQLNLISYLINGLKFEVEIFRLKLLLDARTSKLCWVVAI